MEEQTASGKLSCPSCGSSYQLPADGGKIVLCAYCGTNIVIPTFVSDETGVDEFDSHTAEILAEILNLVRNGEKINAIKLYRQNFNTGLVEAKNAVDQLSLQDLLDSKHVYKIRVTASSDSVVVPMQGQGEFDEIQAKLLGLLAENRKIDAIKIYRNKFDAGLVDAKNAVEKLAATGILDLPGADGGHPPDAIAAAYQPAQNIYQPDVDRPVRKSSRTGFTCFPSVIVLTAILLISGLAAFIWLAGSRNGTAGLQKIIAPVAKSLRGKPVLLNPAVLIDTDGLSPDIVVQARRFDSDPYQNMLVRISTTAGEIAWETESFGGEDDTLDGIYTDGERIYAVVKRKLAVFQAGDGSLLWKAELSDKPGYCPADGTCMLARDGVFLIKTTDQNIQAFQVSNGSLIWQHVTETGYNGLYTWKNWVVTYQNDLEMSRNYLAFLNIQTGKVEKVIYPEQFYGGPMLYFDERYLYILNRTIEKWDLSQTETALVWRIENDKSLEDDRVVVAKDILLAQTSKGVFGVHKQDGSIVEFISQAGFEFMPLTADEEHAIILSRRTRGTAIFGLWAVNLDNGEQLGPINLGEGEVIQDHFETVSSAEQYKWTYRLSGDKLLVVKFMANPGQVQIEEYDVVSGEKMRNLSGLIPNAEDGSLSIREIIGWKKDVLWTMVGNQIIAIDTGSGKITPGY